LPLITLASAMAVHDALAELGLRPDIKWPNDILINEKKICGILAETTETPTGFAVIVGIGINLTSKNFPDELAERATSLDTEVGAVNPVFVEESMLKFLGYFYEILVDNGRDVILEEWRRRSSYFSGKPIRVALRGTVIEGVTDGLEGNGALRVKTPNGEVISVQAGDVERLRTNEQFD
jgi:BirA family biotin operon repressor/biotin-[acetyl-CoA-carboxylase] ligase